MCSCDVPGEKYGTVYPYSTDTKPDDFCIVVLSSHVCLLYNPYRWQIRQLINVFANKTSKANLQKAHMYSAKCLVKYIPYSTTYNGSMYRTLLGILTTTTTTT